MMISVKRIDVKSKLVYPVALVTQVLLHQCMLFKTEIADENILVPHKWLLYTTKPFSCCVRLDIWWVRCHI